MNNTDVGEWTMTRNLTYVRVYESSHMVGFDVPHVTNDMIMRFMGVDISLLPGYTGQWSSKVGEDERPAVHFGEIKETQGIPLLKGGGSDWESWYNAVSAVLILLTLGGIVGAYLFFRRRRAKAAGGGLLGRVQLRGGNSSERDREERVPLAAAEDYELDEGIGSSKHGSARSLDKGKGKQKMDEKEHDEESDAERGESHTVFALGDEEEH